MSSTISASWDASAAISVSTPLLSRAGASPSAAATASAITPASETGASSTSQTPSRKSSSRRAATSRPSRVLPHPAGPASVTSGPRASSRAELVQLLSPCRRRSSARRAGCRGAAPSLPRVGRNPPRGSQAPRGGLPARPAPAPSRPRRDPRARAARGTAPAQPRRDRRRACAAPLPPPGGRPPRRSTGSSSAHRLRTSSSRRRHRRLPAPPSSCRRATCSTWCRLLAAASGARSGQSTAITCSRCRRWPGASASSFTSVLALRRRHAPSGTSWSSTATAKAPSRWMRTPAAGAARDCGEALTCNPAPARPRPPAGHAGARARRARRAGRARRAPAARARGRAGRRPRRPARRSPVLGQQHLGRLLAHLARGVLARAVEQARDVGRARVGLAARRRSCARARPGSCAARPSTSPLPVWQAGPLGTTCSSSASPSQSALALDDRERVAAGRALLPQLAARAAPEPGAGRVASVRSTRLAVGPGEHQHVAGRGVLADAGDEAVAVVGERCGIDAHRIGSPRSRHASFTSSTVCVPSWKIEAASAASAPASSASARCSGRPAPPEATTGTLDGRADRLHELEVVAVLHAVRVHRGDEQLAGARARRPARAQATASQSVGLRPPSTYARQPPSGSRRASIAQTMHCEPKRSAASPIRLGPRERAGVERDLVGAGQQQLAHAPHAVDAAADGERHVDLLGGTLDGAAERARILARGRDVEPDDLVGALLGVAQRRLDGLAAVAQVDEVDALDDAPAGDVEARDDAPTQHRPPSASRRAGTRRRPAPERSGWNCAPATRPSPTRLAKRALLDLRRGQQAARRGVLHGVAVREVARRGEGGRSAGAARRARRRSSPCAAAAARRRAASRCPCRRPSPAVSPSSLRANSSCMPDAHAEQVRAVAQRGQDRVDEAALAQRVHGRGGLADARDDHELRARDAARRRSLTATSAPARSKAARSERRLPAP